MKLTEVEYQKLRPVIIELSQKRGHPREIRIGELLDALKAVHDADFDYVASLVLEDLPSDRDSAVARVLSRLEQEVFDCTGKYPPTIP